MGMIGHVCRTETACQCRPSDDWPIRCCCVWVDVYGKSESRCRICGAEIIAIDLDTGEEVRT